MKHLLFVCLGNICRSPAAEGVMNAIIEKHGLKGEIDCDSAGTNGLHNGERADHRMRKHAEMRGYNLTSKSRQFTHDDFINYDYILTMDDNNFSTVMALDTDDLYDCKVKKIVSFCQNNHPGEVPDPYYGGPDDFELVLNILEDACENLIKEIKDELKA